MLGTHALPTKRDLRGRRLRLRDRYSPNLGLGRRADKALDGFAGEVQEGPKTKGNLDEEETKFLGDVLYELQMAIVAGRRKAPDDGEQTPGDEEPGDEQTPGDEEPGENPE